MMDSHKVRRAVFGAANSHTAKTEKRYLGTAALSQVVMPALARLVAGLA